MNRYTLSDLVKINYGKDHKKLNNGQYPVYGSGGIMRYGDQYLYDGESVLIPRKGSLDNIFFVSGKFWTVDTLFWTKINKKIILPKYLYYCLSRIKLSTFNVGSAVPSLTVKILNEISIDVPSIEIQKNVINQLGIMERKIDLNNRINDNLMSITRNLWSNIKLNSAMKYISILDLSKNVITGKTPSKKKSEYYDNGTIPFIKIPDMHNKTFVIDSKEKLSIAGANSQKIKFIPKRSIIVSCIGTPGLVSITSEMCQTNQQINSIIIDKSIIYAIFLELQNIRNYISNLGSGGTTINNLNKSNFQNIKLKLPSTNTTSKFNAKVNPMFEQILLNELENKNLNIIKKELLEHLF